MSLSPTALKQAFFNILKTDSAGTAVRSALGAGASSVIEKAALVGTLPTLPFLVLWWNSQPSGGPRNRGIKTYYPAWVMYDQIDKGYFRIEALEALIQAAYPETVITGCYLDFLPVRDLIDQKLNNLPARSMPFMVKLRG